MTKYSIDEYGQLIVEGDSVVEILRISEPIIPPLPPIVRHKDWPKVLAGVLHDTPQCQGCGRKARTGHHEVPVGVDPSLELVISNIIPVCLPCHFVICHLGDWQEYNPKVVKHLKLRSRMVSVKIERIIRGN